MSNRLDQLRAEESRLERDKVLTDYIDSTQRREAERAEIRSRLTEVRAEILKEQCNG